MKNGTTKVATKTVVVRQGAAAKRNTKRSNYYIIFKSNANKHTCICIDMNSRREAMDVLSISTFF